MYIKQIVIEGFKSYKDQTIAEPFSPKINVIVGANGSGKSNFFHAIRFVLNDMYANMRPEERQQLLHEGAGHAVLSAYVEVVFDNSDGRFPIDKDEVRLRRTIGLKKDEYFLDKRHITKNEVMNLLESAGFSRANPYYVVQQGKIMTMSTMKDRERLELLKEIGGTRVYEERRSTSLRIMQETESKRAQIEEVVTYIEGKLSELEKDRAELAEYNTLDRTRRSIEYAIFDKDLTDAKATLAEVEASRSALGAERGKVVDEAAAARSRIKELEKEVAAATQQQSALSKELSQLAKARSTALTRRAQLELDVKEARAAQDSGAAVAAAARAELEKLSAEIADAEAKRDEAAEQLATKKEVEHDAGRSLAEKRQRLQALLAKQGRSAQFNSAADRDAYLRGEVSQLEEARAKLVGTRTELQAEAQSLNGELMDISQSIGDKESAVRAASEAINAFERELAELRRARDGALDERKELWRTQEEVSSEYKALEGQQREAQNAANKVIPHDINRGILAMEAIRKSHNIQGVHGALIDLMDVPPQLMTAVEVVAANQLFQIVVDTVDTGMRLVEYLQKDKRGRVTFMPLDRLRVPNVAYPTEFGHDAVPLPKHIKYDQQFDKAVKQVLGKTMVCKNRDTAERVARAGRLDAITVEGDLVNRKGALSGGYADPTRSKIRAHAKIKELEGQLVALQERLRALGASVMTADQRCGQVESAVRQAEPKRKHLKEALDQARKEVAAARADEATKRSRLEAAEARLAAMEDEISDLARKIDVHKAEIGSDMLASLSGAERSELAALQPQVKELEDAVKQAKAQRMQAQARKQQLDDLLSANLLKRRRELTEQLEAEQDKASAAGGSSSSSASGGGSLAALQDALQRAETELEEMSTRVAEAEKELEAASKKARSAVMERDRLRDAAEGEERDAADEARRLESLSTKAATLTQRCDDLARRIRELGSLPADAFEKYQGKSLKELHKALQRVQNQLGKFAHVNKKALDQFANFTEQREELDRRRDEVFKSEGKIKELINALDMRKDEAIERTFKGVAKNFREVFGELVPGGRGELVMQRRHVAQAGEEEGDEEEAEAHDGTLEKYSGVKVKVSFGGGETMSMKQLSGGQKTLVALALIFAIQRCDPAPFYLFDEIDAALDPQYRAAVAKLLRKQANDERNPAMFVVTTFHPQIVQEADKIYGVSHVHRISQIDVITKDDALEFLQSEEEEQAAAQQQQQQGRQKQQRQAHTQTQAQAAAAAAGPSGVQDAGEDDDEDEGGRAGKRRR